MSRIFVALAVLLSTRSALAESAAEIVAASDQVRNPDQPFRVALSIVEYLGGEAHDTVGMIVHSKLDPATRQYRNLVAYAAPSCARARQSASQRSASTSVPNS